VVGWVDQPGQRSLRGGGSKEEICTYVACRKVLLSSKYQPKAGFNMKIIPVMENGE
jgi:hypothetical protein